MSTHGVYLQGRYLSAVGTPHQWVNESYRGLHVDHEEATRLAGLIRGALPILVLEPHRLQPLRLVTRFDVLPVSPNVGDDQS